MTWLPRRRKNPHPLNILLTNGRFPVSIDLARQLRRLGHTIFVVDPMHYHVCRFSRAVKGSTWVPTPHTDAAGFITAVKKVVRQNDIDLIIPMHEEIFYLAESKDPAIIEKLLAPPWETLLRLHNKWTFSEFLGEIGLDAPRARLCKSKEDIAALLREPGEWAVKPVFGRAASNVYHLSQHDPVPSKCDVSEENHYIAQEWITGQRYCSYMVIRSGRVQAFSLYPVWETIDGSSCVYFRSIAHPKIEEYVTKLAAAIPDVGAQLAFDFIETEDRLVAIECNPRATSGIHLFSGTTLLAQALVSGPPVPPLPTNYSTFTVVPPQGTSRQLAPGMMMWKKSERGLKAYLRHMKRLCGSKDVVFSKHDLMPSLMQPFLLTSYYEICRERKLSLPDMFQWDLLWEPKTSLGGVEKAVGLAGRLEEEMTKARRDEEEKRRDEETRRDSGVDRGQGSEATGSV
jgi:hypothetical protein